MATTNGEDTDDDDEDLLSTQIQDPIEALNGGQNTQGTATLAPNQCFRCHKKLTSELRWKKHVEHPPASCRREHTRLQRSRPVIQSAASNQELHEKLAQFRAGTFMPDHIPRDLRRPVAKTLTETLKRVAEENSTESWTALLIACFVILGQPRDLNENERVPLRTSIRQNLGIPTRTEISPPTARKRAPNNNSKNNNNTDDDPDRSLAQKIARKFQDGNITGAIRILTSDETILPKSEELLRVLKSKHPVNVPLTVNPPEPNCVPAPSISPEELLASIQAFPNGSAAGPDGMRPQYLKELGSVKGDDGANFTKALAAVCNLMLRGEVPIAILPLTYGGNLFAFGKKDGGVRPIAVGTALSRMVSRIISTRSRPLSAMFSPIQLGFAVRGGAEAAVHAARYFVETSRTSPTVKVLLRLDVKNALNSLDRNALLRAAKEHLPAYYPYIWQNYGAPTFLLYDNEVKLSQSGLRQGCSAAPLIWCLTTIECHRNLKSEMVQCFLDDDAIGGAPDDVFADFVSITSDYKKLGLVMNVAKCEIVVLGGSDDDQKAVYDRFTKAFPLLRRPTPDQLVHLGAPLTDEATPNTLLAVTDTMQRLTARLHKIPAHQALFLLTHCLGPVKLLYILRTSRAYLHPDLLFQFDEVIRTALTGICNVDVSGSTWQQASLPVAKGGLGIPQTKKLALPAFLASAHFVQQLANDISGLDLDSYLGQRLAEWEMAAKVPLPEPTHRCTQKAWYLPIADATLNDIRKNSRDCPTSEARLKAVSTSTSSAWLRAFPAASLGNLLTDNTLRISVALRLGAPVAAGHHCKCGAWADELGHHALSCPKSSGRHPRHTGVNIIVQRGMASADIPCELEPLGTNFNDATRPDGVALRPSERGKFIAWDGTVVCTLALSHIASTTANAGAAAAAAERGKEAKYAALSPEYEFVALGFETLGPCGPSAAKFITDLGRKIKRVTGEERATDYLLQRISLEIQRGNAISVLKTAPPGADLSEIFTITRPNTKFGPR